jgi:nucleoside-diphosphate-sugar epimerase
MTIKKSLLVTGGLGFIGSHVVERFHPNFDIVVLDWDNETDIAKECAAGWSRKGISIHQKDIADAMTWEKIEPCNFILHAAAQTSAGRSEQTQDRYLWTNCLGTQLLCEYARRNSSKIIFCNTTRVYDPVSVGEMYRKHGAISEDCPTIKVHRLKVEYSIDNFRPGEPKQYVSNLGKIKKKGWYPVHIFPENILDELVESYLSF